jgi:hypothetical protein
MIAVAAILARSKSGGATISRAETEPERRKVPGAHATRQYDGAPLPGLGRWTDGGRDSPGFAPRAV